MLSLKPLFILKVIPLVESRILRIMDSPGLQLGPSFLTAGLHFSLSFITASFILGLTGESEICSASCDKLWSLF